MAFSNENEKKQNHNQQVFEVKQFAPSALFCSYHMTEMAEKPSNFSLCEKEMNYGIAIHWLRARLSFDLLRSAVL
ncbi:unnamed protein product [Pocillopora meandrina]|uniref:Uncharacterized protein n=1 Tax=Pocillopora meandrina TaxID=46732 RepID=A0AAU9VMY7_9CNID|nr:unnamed protein product [Pocillopora meandrina]